MVRLKVATKLCEFLIVGAVLAACAIIDTFDDRAETYNRSAARYANTAEFLNVIRASRFEPLNFVTFSSATGHNTLSGNLGLPSVTLGPGQTAVQHTYTFGPNSTTRSAQNDFILTNVDDPGSYAALMTPVNPAVIGFFIEQGYPRELLFFLLIDQIKVSDLKGSNVEYDRNNPEDPSFSNFGGWIADLLIAGLTAQIDARAIPSAQVIPTYKFCIDAGLPSPIFAGTRKDIVGPSCARQSWQKGASTKPIASYDFIDYSKAIKISVYLRSTYGVYAHLGRVIRNGGNITNILGLTASDDPSLFTVTSDYTNCFIQTDYEGAHYCVPESANNTKRVFALLRQLVGLKITPANPQPTQTVRAIN